MRPRVTTTIVCALCKRLLYHMADMFTTLPTPSSAAFEHIDMNTRGLGKLHQRELIFLLARAVLRTELVMKLLHLVS